MSVSKQGEPVGGTASALSVVLIVWLIQILIVSISVTTVDSSIPSSVVGSRLRKLTVIPSSVRSRAVIVIGVEPTFSKR